MNKGQRHYSSHLEYYRERDKKRRDLFKSIIREAKSCPCRRCKRSFHFSAMEFHHRENKQFEISDLPIISSEKKLRAEIAKCDVVCSNCHQIIEWMKQTGECSPDGL